MTAVPEAVTSADGPRRSTSAEPALAAVALVVLAVVVPLTVVDWTRNAASTTNVLLGMVVVVVSAIRLATIIGTGRPDLLRGFFYLFVYVFLGVSALAQIVAGQYPQDAKSYLDDTVLRGLVLTLVGIAAYEIGWAVYRRLRPDGGTPPVPRRLWYVSRPRVVIVGLIALTATGYQVANNGLASFFLSRSETTGLLTGAEVGNRFYQADDKTGGLLTIFITQVPLFVALFLVLYCRHHRLWPVPRNLMADGVWRLFTVALVVGNVIINNPVGNARFWAALIVVAVVSVYLPYRRPVAVRSYLVLALSILLLVFSALDAFRDSSRTDLNLSGPGTSLVTDPTYGMWQSVVNGIGYVQSYGTMGGTQLLGSVFAFVPRSVWESKAISTGQVIDPKYARSSTLWTEFHVDFGMLGVVVGFVLLGLLSAALTRRAATAVPGILHAVFPVLAVFSVFLLRGSLLPAMGQFDQLLLVLALTVGFRRLGPSQPEPDPSATAAPAGAARSTDRAVARRAP